MPSSSSIIINSLSIIMFYAVVPRAAVLAHQIHLMNMESSQDSRRRANHLTCILIRRRYL